ncbi:MAG: dTDP-glucose 4,6-dehydratase [Fimbriimonadales bacterium]
MNILVTGGAGFIGSNLCRLILEEHPEDQVSVLDALTYAGNLSTIEDLETNERFRFHQGRIEDGTAVRRVLKDDHIDAVINCAAETHNDRSLLEAGVFLTTNVMGVCVLLEIVREMKIPKLVHVSTDEVYGSTATGEFTEESPLKPNTPYSASKAAGDLLCRAHFVSYETPVVVTRGGNTYGPYQYPEKLISFFATRLVDNKKVPVYSEGEQVREWIHVRDHAAGIDAALRKGGPGQVYNISDKNERMNKEIVQVLLERLGKGNELVKKIPDPRKGAHDMRYSMSSDKLQGIGWAPEVPFAEGLGETIDWYAHHQGWWGTMGAKPKDQEVLQQISHPLFGEEP